MSIQDKPNLNKGVNTLRLTIREDLYVLSLIVYHKFVTMIYLC